MYQLIKLYFRLFFKNNKGLLIILILLFTSFSTLYINLHQTKINRDTTTQIYDQYIDKYSGIPNNSKEKQILKELDSYENNEDILKEYQNHQITQKEYLKKQRKNNSKNKGDYSGSSIWQMCRHGSDFGDRFKAQFVCG